MSNLPEIDHLQVSKRVASKVSDTLTPHLVNALLQISQLEVLAEALRDERDEARAETSHAVSERDLLQRSLDELKKDTNDDGV